MRLIDYNDPGQPLPSLTHSKGNMNSCYFFGLFVVCTSFDCWFRNPFLNLSCSSLYRLSAMEQDCRCWDCWYSLQWMGCTRVVWVLEGSVVSKEITIKASNIGMLCWVFPCVLLGAYVFWLYSKLQVSIYELTLLWYGYVSCFLPIGSRDGRR